MMAVSNEDILKYFISRNNRFRNLKGMELGLTPGYKREYEQLKLTKPSYKDIFSMSRFDSYYDRGYGLFARVTRLSDRKRFQLPLADLKAVDKHSAEWQLLDDYSVWFINYQ